MRYVLICGNFWRVQIEFIYLAEKGRLPPVKVDQLFAKITKSNASYTVAPVDVPIVQALRNVPRTLVPEMPDRIITATALALDLPLITCDTAIQQSGVVTTVWNYWP